MSPPGLYLHVPFCKTKCPYCAFSSVSDLALVDRWAAAVREEATLRRRQWSAFDTLYLGGGTPTVLPVELLAGLVRALQETFVLQDKAELSLEANPGDVNRQGLDLLCRSGINRLSLGVQAFDDAALCFLGRRHTARDAQAAIDCAREAGDLSLGLDLIYGFAGQTRDSWRATLERALRFNPEHLSCYLLSVEDGTPFSVRAQAGEALALSEDEQAELFLLTSELLEDHGFVHYEISNFARGDAHRSRHNQKYWLHVPYLGLGSAAHSFTGSERSWNPKSVETYCEALEQGFDPTAGTERLSAEQLRLERIALGLRTRDGVALSLLEGNPRLSETLDRLTSVGLAGIRDGSLAPTRRGFLVADRLPLDLL